MNKTIRIIQNYLIYALPFVIACMVWGSLSPKNTSFFVEALWQIMSWNLMLWFVVLIVFLGLLVIFPSAREKTLKRLANLKERDEREQYITGKASRSAYIATLSLLLFLFFFSIFSVRIARIPKSQAINGKTKSISISLGFHLLNKPPVVTNSDNRQILFDSKNIPLSNSAMLLILILWLLLTFNITARREHQ
jgi:hypothetical protein